MVEQLSASAHSLQGQVETVSNSMRLFRLRPGEATVAEADAVALRKAARVGAPAQPAAPQGEHARPGLPGSALRVVSGQTAPRAHGGGVRAMA
jgi:aerotaxis receptor